MHQRPKTFSTNYRYRFAGKTAVIVFCLKTANPMILGLTSPRRSLLEEENDRFVSNPSLKSARHNPAMMDGYKETLDARKKKGKSSFLEIKSSTLQLVI
ncbi:hypothetical protein CEXT_516661 [Caerostris extrusa]|uniref:Uncharacterized protein n=1 Tax=Caerostris extrusa TaxID=172846 RepID=A0AAV4PHB5_CAEEX|nr:hypothetical protein CEXT_516661 [Caerostris extrusa]